MAKTGKVDTDRAIGLLQHVDDSSLTFSERAELRCALAKELEQAGNYEAARGAMGDLWDRVGERPALRNLDERAAAEVLLRVGSLSGWIGGARQIAGAQETAKNLITESAIMFRSLGEEEKAAEAQIEIAWCYWREGAFDEARIILGEALSQLAEADVELKALALVRCAEVERAANRLNDALRILTESAILVEASVDHTLKGKFHTTLATVLKNLGASERRDDYIDRALIEYAAASYHFEQAGHLRFRAAVENNLGLLHLAAGRYTEAHDHLDQARRLFVSLKDDLHCAQVDETRARGLLAQGQNSDAERVIRAAVHTLEQGDQHALLAEALATHGTALARLSRYAPARVALERATVKAEEGGDREGAGRAALTLVEELRKHLTLDEMQGQYERADRLLSSSQHRETRERLYQCARYLITARNRRAKLASECTPGFVHQAEETAELLRFVERVAATDQTVLVTGETGTGKEVLARVIHQCSGRSGNFVAINCATLSDTLFESQLFGHLKGSFTDAVEDHLGAVREAAGGTLFLDEIGELRWSNQAKLLRLIEHGEICPLGSGMPERVDVRIIAATNHDLPTLMAANRFREDLFHRLTPFHIEIPPLRERPSDIVALAKHFISVMETTYNRRVEWTAESLEALQRLELRGNARELRTLIERTMLTSHSGDVITEEAVVTLALRQTTDGDPANAWRGCDLAQEVQRFEGQLIERALRASIGSITRAARLLGMRNHQTLSFMLNTRHQGLRPDKAKLMKGCGKR